MGSNNSSNYDNNSNNNGNNINSNLFLNKTDYPSKRDIRRKGGGTVKTVLITATSVLLTVLFMLIAVYFLVSADFINIGKESEEKTETVEKETEDKKEEEKDSSEEKEETQTQPEQEAEETAQEMTMYVANVPNSIYLRSEPKEVEGNHIATIPFGTKVTFLENTDAIFAKVSYGELTGYVKREYLSTTVPKKPQTTTTTTNSNNTTVQKYMYVANVPNSIYLRSSAAEISGNTITTIPVGTQVGYIEKANSEFSKIKYNGMIGYAKTKYLEDDYYEEETASYMTVTGVPNSIYLRSSASDANDDNIICTIPVGSTVLFEDFGNGTFYKISWSGYTGYSKSKFLSWQ